MRFINSHTRSEKKFPQLTSHPRPHTLPPERLYLAHLAPYLSETEKQLQADLKQTQAENEDLALRIQSQREEVEKVVAGLESVVRDLEGANLVMGEVVEGENIVSEVREIEEDLRGATAGRDAKL